MITRLRDQLYSMERDLLIKTNRCEILTEQKERLEVKIEELDVLTSEQALQVLQKLSSRQRQVAKLRLEELGTQALQFSLGKNYRMEIEVEEVRKRPQAYLTVINEATGIKTEPLDDNGGGVVDIISIALRMVVLQAMGNIDGPIILDEPFKMVSEEFVPMLSEFLNKISNDFGRQIIMITHNKVLAESCESKIIL